MRGLYEIGRGGQMNKRTACLISLYELEYPHCTLVTSFCLFVCFLVVVVVVVVQLFFLSSGLLRQPSFIDIFSIELQNSTRRFLRSSPKIGITLHPYLSITATSHKGHLLLF